MRSISVVDYGVGNLKSVSRAIEEAGGSVKFIKDSESLLSADRILLPGVGAFGHCVNELKNRQLFDSVKAYIEKERPLLGICVGMQMLLDVGLEFGKHEGLGFISGEVAKIPVPSKKVKLPHIGWNNLSFFSDESKKCPLLSSIKESDYFYFLHSYRSVPSTDQNVLATTDYEGVKIPALIGRGSVYGCQFHPEKSGVKGIQVLKNFLSL